jgi:hypothetical protein
VSPSKDRLAVKNDFLTEGSVLSGAFDVRSSLRLVNGKDSKALLPTLKPGAIIVISLVSIFAGTGSEPQAVAIV